MKFYTKRSFAILGLLGAIAFANDSTVSRTNPDIGRDPTDAGNGPNTTDTTAVEVDHDANAKGVSNTVHTREWRKNQAARRDLHTTTTTATAAGADLEENRTATTNYDKSAKKQSSDYQPDNTGKNERDRSGETKTSGDQSNSSQDIKITADIRRAIVKDDSLTSTAKNVKVITAGGVVTLRGPVNSAEEKSKIEQLATAAAGGAKVDNQLEVKDSH